MVKKRMAMRMVTIFVALIVCGMFFPGLARGAGTSIDTELDPGASDVVVFNEDIGEVLVGEVKSTFVGITNTSGSELKIWLALNRGAECPTEYFEYIGPNMYPDDTNIQFRPGDTLTVEVTFSPSKPVDVCTAFLQITPIVPGGNGVRINFTAEGVEKTSETFEEIVIGGFQTGVTDREAKLDENNSTLKEMIGICEATAYNSGQLRRCVKRLARQLMWEGTIDYQEMRALDRAATKAEIRKMVKKVKASRRLKTSKSSGRSKWWCWWRH